MAYVSPWRLLGEDLRAVAASLVLRARELWRRNGSADLPRPAAWPRRWAALFWPLVLVGALLLLLAIGRLAGLGSSRPALPTPLPAPSVATGPAVDGPAGAGAADGEEPMDAVTEGVPPSVQSLPEALSPAPGSPSEPSPSAAATPSEAPPEAPSAAPTEAPSAAPELVLDPLLELLAEGGSEGLIVAARPRPEQGRLELELDGAAFLALPLPQRQSQADLWQQRAAELGYDALDLVEAAGGEARAGAEAGAAGGRLLGHQARVGRGMILLAFG